MEKRKKRSPETTKRRVSPPADPLVEVHRFREVLYLFLSRSLSREADAPFLRDARIILKALQSLEDKPLVRGKQLLEIFFQETKKTKNEIVLRDLAEQYASLFLGVGPETISLCESAYRHERGLLFQDSYFEILGEYRKAGLTKRQDFTEPEDHLAVELAFMADLCRRSLSAIQKGEKEAGEQFHFLQKKFLDEHILTWTHRFTEGLLNLRPSGFYGAVAHLLRGYLEVDRAWIDELFAESESNQDRFPSNARKTGKKEVKRQASKKKTVEKTEFGEGRK